MRECRGSIGVFRSFACGLNGPDTGSLRPSRPAFGSMASCRVATAASQDFDPFVNCRCSSQGGACSLVSASLPPLSGRRNLRSTLVTAGSQRLSHPTWTVTLSSVVLNRVCSAVLRPPRLKTAILAGYAACLCYLQRLSEETSRRHWAAASDWMSCRDCGSIDPRCGRS